MAKAYYFGSEICEIEELCDNNGNKTCQFVYKETGQEGTGFASDIILDYEK